MKDRYETQRDITFRGLLLIYASLFICKNILPANITVIMNAFSTTRNAIALMIGLDFIVVTISILFFGYFGEKLTEKYSVKTVFTVTQIGWVGCFGLIPFTVNFGQYASLIVLSAVFRGAYLPLAFGMVGDFYGPRERGTKYGWLNFGLILGSGGGLIFGTLLGAIPTIGWRLAYGVGFGLGGAAVLGYWRRGIKPQRGRYEPAFEDLEDAVSYNYKITFQQVKEIFRSKSVSALIISVLITGIATSTLGLWTLDYFENSQMAQFGENARIFAMLFYIIAGLGALPGNVQGGKIGDSHYQKGHLRGRVIIALLGILIGIACMFGFYLLPFQGTVTWELILSAIVILGLGFIAYWLLSFPVGNQFAIYSEICVPEARSSVNALHGVMINIGGAIGNFLLASTITTQILPLHISMLLCIWLVGGLLWIIPYFTYPKEAQACHEIMLTRRTEIQNKLNE
ncbi:MAG: MFS transporter [Candidatus Helarchaeota archaeon]